MYLTHFECSECALRHPTDRWQSVCTACGHPLAARYDLGAAGEAMRTHPERARPAGMWRFAELLPLPAGETPISLGEGDTPLLELPRLAAEFGIARLTLKDEGQNPGGSFKARGMSVAVTMAARLGATGFCAPSAGNAGGALAAYGARAGLPVVLALPTDVPRAHRLEAEIHGAEVHLVDGTIGDCGRYLARIREERGLTDLSTLKEPWRLEGKKTMGLEIAEQLEGQLPDAILYPTGGGTGLIGIPKAFEELVGAGRLDPALPLPRLYAVQAAECAPIAAAIAQGSDDAIAPPSPRTIAAGLRVPTPFAHRWMLRVIRATGGGAIAVPDLELLAGTERVARREGVFAAPEAGALVAALDHLIADGSIQKNEHVLLLCTGSGLKYGECWGW